MSAMAQPDCWANGIPIRCFKCRNLLGNMDWYMCNVAPDASSGGTMMPFHRNCAPIVFSGPTFGPGAAELAALKKDAERYRWLRDQASHFSPDPWSLFRPRMTYMLDSDCWDSAIDEAMNAVIEGNA